MGRWRSAAVGTLGELSCWHLGSHGSRAAALPGNAVARCAWVRMHERGRATSRADHSRSRARST